MPSRRRILRAPAVQALLIQMLSFVLVLATTVGIMVLTGLELPAAAITIVHGTLAAVLTRWRSLAPWWVAIQFFFPIAVAALSALHLPPSIYLVAFMTLLCLYWTTFRTQVPYYPSSVAVWEAVAALMPEQRRLRVIDIGCGIGGLVLHLAARRPDCDVIGIEVAPLPWLISTVRARMRTSRARFVRGDYERLDFSDYDIVFAYLSPAAMPSLWQKAREEMRAGSLLLSHEFEVPGVEPDFVVHPTQAGPAIYGWRIA